MSLGYSRIPSYTLFHTVRHKKLKVKIIGSLKDHQKRKPRLIKDRDPLLKLKEEYFSVGGNAGLSTKSKQLPTGSFLSKKILQINQKAEHRNQLVSNQRLQEKINTVENLSGGEKEIMQQAKLNGVRNQIDKVYSRFFRTDGFNKLIDIKLRDWNSSKTEQRDHQNEFSSKPKLVPKKLVTRKLVRTLQDNIVTRPIKKVLQEQEYGLILIPERKPMNDPLSHSSAGGKPKVKKLDHEIKSSKQTIKRNSFSGPTKSQTKEVWHNSPSNLKENFRSKGGQDKQNTSGSKKPTLQRGHTLDSEAFEGISLADQNGKAVQTYKHRLSKYHQLIDSKLNALPTYSEREALDCIYWSYYTPKSKQAKELSDKQIMKLLKRKKPTQKPKHISKQVRVLKSDGIVRRTSSTPIAFQADVVHRDSGSPRLETNTSALIAVTQGSPRTFASQTPRSYLLKTGPKILPEGSMTAHRTPSVFRVQGVEGQYHADKHRGLPETNKTNGFVTQWTQHLQSQQSDIPLGQSRLSTVSHKQNIMAKRFLTETSGDEMGEPPRVESSRVAFKLNRQNTLNS